MKCAKHPEIDSVAFCGYCGRALCAACKHEVRGMIYCEDCLAARLGAPGLTPLIGGPGMGPSPGVALGLGFIPGVGAIYNGQIVKAMVQVLLFVSFITLGDRVPELGTVFHLGAVAFYFYMVIDSYQTARARQFGQPVPEWFGMGDLKMNAPIGAALLIGIGVLFLLDNLGVQVFQHIGKFWPVLLIVVGVVLLQKRMGGGGPPPLSGPEIPSPPREGPTNIPGPHGL
jgi:hypothetical protein